MSGTRYPLSGSTNGRQIKVAATSTPGTLLHTCISGVSDYDEAWIWGTNTHATDNVDLTIEWGGVTDPDDLLKTTLAAGVGLIQVVPGLILQNSLVIRAFASSANQIMISGFVCRIPLNPNIRVRT